MPANSGSISGTVAHKHSVPSGDGGELSEGITNFSGGNVGEVLTATATAIPQWTAPAGGSSTFTPDGTAHAATVQASLDVTGMTGRDITQIIYFVCDNDSGTSNLRCQINGETGNTYNNTNQFGQTGSSYTCDTTTGDSSFLLSNAAGGGWTHSGIFYIYRANSDFASVSANVEVGTTTRGLDNMCNMIGDKVRYLNDSTGINDTVTAAPTSIKFFFDGQDIAGNIQVNSMDYQ